MRRRPGQALNSEGVAKEVKSNAQEMLGKAWEALRCAIDSAKLEAEGLADRSVFLLRRRNIGDAVAFF